MDATEDELLEGPSATPLFGSLGHAAEFIVGRGLQPEESCGVARDGGAAVLYGGHGLARPAKRLVLMLAQHPCTSLSALQVR
jgi:hypothetical protein